MVVADITDAPSVLAGVGFARLAFNIHSGPLPQVALPLLAVQPKPEHRMNIAKEITELIERLKAGQTV